ncbi:MAG: MotA/TolQ/ExbB proton channel family protein [Desulfuromonadales bacterium]|nr:MotA/TolQ/ExbB proton channel family protein [Desulfuromonadales bacterium]MBN2792388.1 MotA/TolQ/ExbB proton channel family protein [Desulfuromonadales bacterium]
MIEIFVRGGPLMYPILVCSVIGWAIFMERLYAYFRVRAALVSQQQKVIDLLHQEHVEDAVEFCRQQLSPLTKILLVVLKSRGGTRAHLKALAEEIGEREAVGLQRYLGLLGTIANISPLLGLLGTVLGMIKAFNVIATEGMGTPATLGGGISEALITTAAGLSVAVPMILLHRYLTSRAERLVLELEEATMRIIDLVEG